MATVKTLHSTLSLPTSMELCWMPSIVRDRAVLFGDSGFSAFGHTVCAGVWARMPEGLYTIQNEIGFTVRWCGAAARS